MNDYQQNCDVIISKYVTKYWQISIIYVSILKQQQIRMNYIEEISIKVKQKIWKIIKYQKLLLLYINW